jgi:hypothetical protein
LPSSAADALPPNKIPLRRPFVVLVLVLPAFWRERRFGMWIVGSGKEVARRGAMSVVLIVDKGRLEIRVGREAV